MSEAIRSSALRVAIAHSFPGDRAARARAIAAFLLSCLSGALLVVLAVNDQPISAGIIAGVGILATTALVMYERGR